MSTNQSLFTIFPPEVTCLVLQYLISPAETRDIVFDIRSLALTSHAFYDFLSGWASYMERHTIATLRELDLAHTLPSVEFPRASLSLLLKRLANVCTFCDMRSYRAEPFTNLQVCTACEEEHFPKISLSKLKTFYSHPHGRKESWLGVDSVMVVGPDYSSTNSCCSKPTPSGPFFRWVDIQKLISMREITLNEPSTLQPSWDSNRFYNEDYHPLHPPHCRTWEWHRNFLWSSASLRWNKGICPHQNSKLSEYRADLTLFQEFRYQFDPYFQPQDSERERRLDYFRIINCWKENWAARPWSLLNFPSLSQMSVTNPYVTEGQRLKVRRELQEYRYRCRKLRRVLGSSPDILWMPSTWRFIMDNPQCRIETTLQIKTVVKTFAALY
jgi:hypothetical protein